MGEKAGRTTQTIRSIDCPCQRGSRGNLLRSGLVGFASGDRGSRVAGRERERERDGRGRRGKGGGMGAGW